MTARWAVHDRIIVLCERLEIAAFVDYYIKYLRNQGETLPELRIVNISSLENLPMYLQNLEAAEGFDKVEKILLVADAGIKRRVTEHHIFKIKKHSFLQDFDFEMYLFPHKSVVGNWMPGFLEDLLLQALKQETSEYSNFYNLQNIAREYLFSVNISRSKEKRLQNYNRSFLYSYFAGTEKFVGLRMSEAAAKGAFDLEYKGFKDLREFLTGLEK